MKDVAEEDYIRAAAVWAVGQLAGHSSNHSTAICATDVVPTILAFTKDDVGYSDDLRNKASLYNHCDTRATGQRPPS